MDRFSFFWYRKLKVVSVMKFFLRRIIFFFFPRIIESSLIHKITETRANISNNDSQRSEFVGKLIDSDNRDSDPIAIGDEQLNYHRFEFERFNSQQRITRTTPERERERETFHYQNRIETWKSASCDRKSWIKNFFLSV